MTPAFGFPAYPKLEYGVPGWQTRGANICWPSGLRVISIGHPEQGFATISTVIDGGRAGDPVDKRGTAHLLEHLWFRSTHGDGVSVMDAGAGLVLDASTRVDTTVYTTVAPASDLKTLIDVEVRRLSDPLHGIAPDVFLAEREVVVQELQLRGKHVERVAIGRMETLLFPDDHPYGGGRETVDNMRALTLEDAARHAFVRGLNVPGGQDLDVDCDLIPGSRASEALCVLGFPNDVDPREVVQAIRRGLPAMWGFSNTEQWWRART